MSEHDQTFDPNILIGHCDVISRVSDFALYLGIKWFMNTLLSKYVCFDKTFDPEVVLGHCDLISRFSDFALYLDTQLIYFHTFFRL